MSSLFFGDSHAAYVLIRLNVHSNRLRLIRDVGKWGDGYLCPTTFSLHCHYQNDCIKAGSSVRHFNVSLSVWAKSQDSVHKPQFLKRKESRSGSNRGPSAYQPSALPLGQLVAYSCVLHRQTTRACFFFSSVFFVHQFHQMRIRWTGR